MAGLCGFRRKEKASGQRGKDLMREGGRGGTKREGSLLFSRFVVDEAHGVLVFDDPFDELSLGQALCKRSAGEELDMV